MTRAGSDVNPCRSPVRRRAFLLASIAAVGTHWVPAVAPAEPPTNRPPSPPPGRPRATPDAPLDELLDRPVNFTFNGGSFADAAGQLSRASGVRIEVDRAALVKAGDGTEPRAVRMKLSGVPVRQVLRLIRGGAVNPHAAGIAIEPDPDARVVRVLSDDDLKGVERVYPAGDLLDVAAGDDLLKLVTGNVNPDVWHRNGGAVGRATIVGRSLHVTQTHANHAEVAALLAKVRTALAGRPVAPDRVAGAVRAATARPVGVNVDGLSWRDALQRAADAAGVNLFVDERSLEAAGIDLAARASPPAGPLTFDRLAAAATKATRLDEEYAPLRFTADGPVLWVSSDEAALRLVDLRCYDIRPHVAVLREGPGVEGRTTDDAIEFIVRRLQETVDPDSWRDNGGWAGAIRDFGSRILVVTQTAENHTRVAAVLSGSVARPSHPRDFIRSR